MTWTLSPTLKNALIAIATLYAIVIIGLTVYKGEITEYQYVQCVWMVATSLLLLTISYGEKRGIIPIIQSIALGSGVPDGEETPEFLKDLLKKEKDGDDNKNAYSSVV